MFERVIYVTTGDRMKARRKELDIPVEDVAAALNVSVATIYRYENGDIEKVPGYILDPLSKVLNTTPSYLMGWDENPPAQTDERIWDTICADGEKLRLVNWIASLDQDTFRRMEKILNAAFDL